MRIERYSTIIAGPDFIKFENVEDADLAEDLDDDFIVQDSEAEDGRSVQELSKMSDLISLDEASTVEYNVAEENAKVEENMHVKITERGSEEETRRS